jgi:putative transposase
MTSYPTRRSIRLTGYDYSRPGAYFVTLCVEQRLPLLGSVIGDEVHWSAAGEMVARIWANLGTHYPGVSVDASIVMPNHLHGILVLSPPCETGDDSDTRKVLSLSTVIQRFKTYTAHCYGQGVASEHWPRYPGRLWQHRFYEHVIRNDHDLQAIGEYIANNPHQWALDRLNPDQMSGT